MISSKTYDIVYSLGQWCGTSMCLKELGLRSVSGPFDWTGPEGRISLYVELMTNGFSGFFAKESLRKIDDDFAEGTEVYVDDVQRWQTRHEFKIGVSFEENYARYRALLDRRIGRLLGSLRSRGRVLFVHWLAEGHYHRADVVSDMKRLRETFPNATIDLLVLETEPFVSGVSYEEVDKGIMFAVGDFYDRTRYDAVVGNKRLVAEVFRKIHLRGRLRNLLRGRLESFRRRISRYAGGRG